METSALQWLLSLCLFVSLPLSPSLCLFGLGLASPLDGLLSWWFHINIRHNGNGPLGPQSLCSLAPPHSAKQERMEQAEEMRSAETKPEWKLRQKYKMFISSLMRQTTLRENGNYNLTVTDWRCYCCCCTPTNSVASWAYLLQEARSLLDTRLGQQVESLGVSGSKPPAQGLYWLCHLHHHHLLPPQLLTPL